MTPAGATAQLPAGSLPARFEMVAPPQWQAIDFISDLHLCEAMPRTFEAWAEHLHNTPADAVFMLGDLFEVWVGDDMRTLAFEQRCAAVMARASARRSLFFMAGNRDFLLGPAMLHDSGASMLPDPSVLDAWGQRVMLSHGDGLCLDDLPYQAFRQQVRSADWQASFLSKPLSERLAIAAEMRRVSAGRQRFDGNVNIDIDATETLRWMSAMHTPALVHGHTHRPASQQLVTGFSRHVLSDWDLDTGQRAEVLRLDRAGFTRIAPSRSG